MCPKSRGLWFHNCLILVLLGGVCGSLDSPLHCLHQRSHWVYSTCKLAGQLGGRAGWASCTDTGHLMSLLIIPFLRSQPEVYVHLFQQAYQDSGHTGVLASACTLCPMGAGGYGSGGCGVEHPDRPTVVFLSELQGPMRLTLSAGHNGGMRVSHACTWMGGAGRILEV